jgi:hypothetical protein
MSHAFHPPTLKDDGDCHPKPVELGQIGASRDAGPLPDLAASRAVWSRAHSVATARLTFRLAEHAGHRGFRSILSFVSHVDGVSLLLQAWNPVGPPQCGRAGRVI